MHLIQLLPRHPGFGLTSESSPLSGRSLPSVEALEASAFTAMLHGGRRTAHLTVTAHVPTPTASLRAPRPQQGLRRSLQTGFPVLQARTFAAEAWARRTIRSPWEQRRRGFFSPFDRAAKLTDFSPIQSRGFFSPFDRAQKLTEHRFVPFTPQQLYEVLSSYLLVFIAIRTPFITHYTLLLAHESHGTPLAAGDANTFYLMINS